MKRPSSGSTGNGILPAVASAIIPGVGQLINGESDKALGVFIVWGLTLGLNLLTWIPVLGTFFWLIGAATWVYAVADGYVTGKKQSALPPKP